MADDLKLSVVIQALLDAKGFEDAKANLGELAGKAKEAAPDVKGFSDRITGARGPVADLTRVILINVGAMRGAGEAAKFAGVGLAALNAGAIGASLPIIGLTAAIAVITPLISEWMESQKNLNEEQEKLRDKLLQNLDLVNQWVATVPNASAATHSWAEALRELEFEKTTKQLHEMRAELDKLTTEALARGETFKSPEILALEAEIEKIHEARREGLTVEEQFKRDADAAKRGAAIVSENLKNVNASLAQHFKALNAIKDFNDQAERDQERVAREGIEKPSTTAQRRRKLEEESELILAQIKNAEDLAEAKRQLAEAERFQTAQGLANIAASAGALSALFNRNKGLAIAEAIVNAAAGSVAAGRDTHGPVWVRIAAIAAFWTTALAQIQAIRSAEPVGFDDPFADLTARRLGRKSAVDFVQNFGQEFIPGVRAGMGMMGGSVHHNTTINRGVTVQGGVSLTGFMGAGRTEMLKALNRELIKIARLERRTTVGR